MVYSRACLFVIGSLLLSPVKPSPLLPTENGREPKKIKQNVRHLEWISDLIAKVSKVESSQPTPAGKATENPTPKPILQPMKPSVEPTTNHPSPSKSSKATQAPTNLPTEPPTKYPSTKPPTPKPTTKQTTQPPTNSPTESPSNSPSTKPATSCPTKEPTSPTTPPSGLPTKTPTAKPITASPTTLPSVSPSISPSRSPSTSPSMPPSQSPSKSASKCPSTKPAPPPTTLPSTSPSNSSNKDWTHQIKLMASDNKPNSMFGYRVSIFGNIIAVGAASDHYNVDESAAYIFERNQASGNWEQKAKLTANDGAISDHFGSSVCVSGNILVVGSDGDDDKGEDSGSAYIFERNEASGNWEQKAKLTAIDGSSGDNFGHSVAVAGNVVFVGADSDDDKGVDSGSVYIFERSEENGNWVQSAKLVANDGAVNDRFGSSVSVFENVLVVGAHSLYYDCYHRGFAYIFERNDISCNWEQKAKFYSNYVGPGCDYFGKSVGVSGSIVVVGAGWNPRDYAGSAYIYERSKISGNWEQKAMLIANDRKAGDNFGQSVAVSGNVVIVGAVLVDDNGVDSGSAYIFERNTTSSQWEQKAKLLANDGYTFDFFGFSVGVSGYDVVVGTPRDDNDSGSVYIF